MFDQIMMLIAQIPGKDSIGNCVNMETRREVYCEKSPVTRTQYYQAGRLGLRPGFSVTVRAEEYQGEPLAEYQGGLYEIYKTLEKGKETELYLSGKEGG